MPTPNRPLPQNKYPEQYMGNSSFDEDFGVNTVESLGFDGRGLQRTLADSLTIRLVEDGTTMYIALAKPGTATTDAYWQCIKLDTSAGVVLTYADGDADFNNTANNLASLSYS